MDPPRFDEHVQHRNTAHHNQPRHTAPSNSVGGSYNPYQKSASYFNEPPLPPSHAAPSAGSWQQPGSGSWQQQQQGPGSGPPNYFYGSRNGDASGFNPNEYMAEPMMNFAKAYGEQLAEQSKQQIEKYVSVTKLKYYFDVDNAYVGKKLALLLFPFAHREWVVKYSSREEPVPPRYDVNAPDLYIPMMAIVTYILVAGLLLGTQDRFSPEQLGILASSALAWLFFENVIVLITKYIMNISQALRTWDTLAFCSYKYIGMIFSLIVFLFGGQFAYYCALGYSSLAIVFFLIRTVKSFVLENFSGADGRKRKLYLLLFISFTQPFVMWWLTSSLTSFKITKKILPIPGLDDVEM